MESWRRFLVLLGLIGLGAAACGKLLGIDSWVDVACTVDCGVADTSVDATDADAPLDADANALDAGRATIGIAPDLYSAALCGYHADKIYCWGDDGCNAFGQLGFPIDAGAIPGPLPIPLPASPRKLADALAVGGTHVCAIYGRDVWCRGRNEGHQRGNASLGNGPDETMVLGLPADGVDTIAAGDVTTCALTLRPAAGTASVYCWGTITEGALGRPVTDMRDLDRAWGVVDTDGGLLRDARFLAAGRSHACAITSAHKVLCWGSNAFFESGPTAPTDTVCNCSGTPQEVTMPTSEIPTTLALGERHSCALMRSGTVYCWGADEVNQLGTATPPPCTPPSDAGVVSCTGTPVKVTGLTNIGAIASGLFHSCALDDHHNASCWGWNASGSLGHGDAMDHMTPVTVLDVNTTSPATFDELALGGGKSCGRLGTVVSCWGTGVLGTAAGDAATPDHLFPAPVVGW